MELNKARELDAKYLMHTYSRYPICIERGEGCYVYDDKGKRYLDFGSGIGVNSLGYAHPAWVGAVQEQAARLAHISNLYYTDPMLELAEKLVPAAGMARAFFANSGAEANEGAIKLARKYSFDKYGGTRNMIITLSNSFHGRTITTLRATGQDKYHEFFHPFTEGFLHCGSNDLVEILRLMEQDVCAIMMESVQGEGGVIPLGRDFVRQVAVEAAARDILVIFDEVQAGLGRTGKLMGYDYFDVKPDIVTLAKGLGGGLPIGAVLCNEHLADTLGPAQHGSTFGANPVCCAGACVVMDALLSPGFIDSVAEKGAHITDTVKSWNLPAVADVRGLGLMLGIEIAGREPRDVAERCMELGLIVLTAGKDAVRLLPPLVISMEEIDEGLGILKKVLEGN